MQLCNVVGDVTIFGTASAHKHDSMKDKVSHVFSHDIDYIQEIRKCVQFLTLNAYHCYSYNMVQLFTFISN